MIDTESKSGVEPLPTGGRIFGDTSDLKGYRRTLRHARALVHAPGSFQEKPNWGHDIVEECKPLFEVLGPEVAVPVDPGKELLRIREEAKQEGYSEGIQEAKDTVESIIARYHDAILDIEVARDRMLADTEIDVVNLALLIAREAVRNESEARVRFTETMVAHCLSQLRLADKITLRINSTDLETVRERHPEYVSEETVVRLVADPNLALGGVIAECSLGRIDASFDRRITDIAQQLLDKDSVIRPALERELMDQSEVETVSIEKLDENVAPIEEAGMATDAEMAVEPEVAVDAGMAADAAADAETAADVAADAEMAADAAADAEMAADAAADAGMAADAETAAESEVAPDVEGEFTTKEDPDAVE